MNNIRHIDLEKLDPIVKKSVVELIERSKVGIDKYGTTLAENNTDDFLQHFKEELMDAINYVNKIQSDVLAKKQWRCVAYIEGCKQELKSNWIDDRNLVVDYYNEIYDEMCSKGFRHYILKFQERNYVPVGQDNGDDEEYPHCTLCRKQVVKKKSD